MRAETISIVNHINLKTLKIKFSFEEKYSQNVSKTKNIYMYCGKNFFYNLQDKEEN